VILMQFILIAAGSGILFAQSQTASSPWEARTSEDVFTGSQLVFLENTGEVIAGEPGATQLVFRRSGETAELFWASPHSYICELLPVLRTPS